jgi:glycerophosphoryl diester phosphodiesterase
MTFPLYLETNDHRTWLKWHRGRRKASDPVFGATRIIEAMRIGASVEIDLVIHADHGCAVLHNFELSEETTGHGLVRETPASLLRQLNLRDNSGTVLPEKVLLLEDLCALLDDEPAHPEALLQLDFKEGRAAIDDETVRTFANTLKNHAGAMILSGGDFAAIDLLANAVPGLKIGYDPCHGDSLDRLKLSGDYDSFIEDALATAPDAELIYLHHEIILQADRDGFDMIAAVHADHRRVDAWTLNKVDAPTIAKAQRLIALRVDQITTDDPEGLHSVLTS